MSFFNKIYDISHTDLFKHVFHSASDKVFVANVSKISTFNENVLDSKLTLTSRTFRLVAASASQQIRVCEASLTNAYSLLMIATSRRQKDDQDEVGGKFMWLLWNDCRTYLALSYAILCRTMRSKISPSCTFCCCCFYFTLADST